MNLPQREPIEPELMAAIELALGGESHAARERLSSIWARLAPEDSFHRCILAHYMADLQTTAAEELSWDLIALQAAVDGSPSAFDDRIPDLTWASFLPSLYLNVAASYERCGSVAAERAHAECAEEHSRALGDDPLAELTRGAISRLRAALRE